MAGSNTDDIDPVWPAVPVEQLLRQFDVDPQRGLHAIARPAPPPKPPWRTFARQFKSLLICILFGAQAREPVPVSDSVAAVPEATGAHTQGRFDQRLRRSLATARSACHVQANRAVHGMEILR